MIQKSYIENHLQSLKNILDDILSINYRGNRKILSDYG